MKCLPKIYVFAQIQSSEDLYTVLKESEYRERKKPGSCMYISFFSHNVVGPLDNGQTSIAIL